MALDIYDYVKDYEQVYQILSSFSSYIQMPQNIMELASERLKQGKPLLSVELGMVDEYGRLKNHPLVQQGAQGFNWESQVFTPNRKKNMEEYRLQPDLRDILEEVDKEVDQENKSKASQASVLAKVAK